MTSKQFATCGLALLIIASSAAVRAQLVTYNSAQPAGNVTARQGWLDAVGIAAPQYRVDFESGFVDEQNVSNQPGLFPGGLVVRDLSPANQATVQQGPGSISLSNPVGQFALTHTPVALGDLLLDFSANPLDHVAYQDIDTTSNNSIVTLSFLGGGTMNFFPDDTLTTGDSAEFLGFYRNDLPPITGVRLNLGGDAYGLDNLEYGLLPTPRWDRDGGGRWGAPENWAGGVPDAEGAAAHFRGVLMTRANAPAVITLDEDRTVGAIWFNNGTTNLNGDVSSYVIAPGIGAGRLILDNGADGWRDYAAAHQLRGSGGGTG